MFPLLHEYLGGFNRSSNPLMEYISYNLHACVYFHNMFIKDGKEKFVVLNIIYDQGFEGCIQTSRILR